jgi:hypothetical protein
MTLTLKILTVMDVKIFSVRVISPWPPGRTVAYRSQGIQACRVIQPAGRAAPDCAGFAQFNTSRLDKPVINA